MFGVSGSSNQSIDSLLNNAKNTEDYIKIETQATEIIVNNSLSETEINNAKIQRGQARLGKLNVDAISILADFQSLAEDKSSNSQQNNIFNKITIVDDVDLNDLKAASTDLNEADSSSSVTLTQDEQNVRAMANALTAVKAIKKTYIVQSDGQLDPQNNVSAEDAFDQVIADGVTTSLDNSVDAYAQGANFNSDQQQEIDNIKFISKNIVALNTAKTGGGTYSPIDKDGNPLTGSSISSVDFSSGDKNVKISSAMNDIFGHVSN